MSRRVDCFVPVPQKYMGLVIGKKGRNIERLKQETQTSIRPGNAKESGFIVNGSPSNCDAACKAIRRHIENAVVTISELVPQEFVRLVTRRDGMGNYRQMEEECDVKITWPNISGTEKHVKFNIKGSTINCERAAEMLRTNVENWTKNDVCHKDAHPLASDSRNNTKIVEKRCQVWKEYLRFILGKNQKNKERIETKSETKIKVLKQNETETEAILVITGEEQNCIRAISLIRSYIVFYKECKRRDELGGNLKFPCVDFGDENNEFQLKQDRNTPKLNSFIKGGRYRIETKDNYNETEVSDKTISELKKHLLTSLQMLHSIKDEKKLMIDLWCHFGKAFVDNVDEEEAKRTISREHINKRIEKIFNPEKRTDKDSSWGVSFEEGVDPSLVNMDVLPECGDEDDDFQIKQIHTQWRYEFGFTTPSVRNVRLKAWDGLPSEANEPPVEVKYILTNVNIREKEDIKAWICYPSTTVLRGEILTPNSQYDCRMKLRAGSRYVIDKDIVCEEEDRILCDYLSDCKFDAAAKNRMNLPEAEMPEGFECTFYRESEEKMFSATADGECFTVILLEQKGWDSDSSSKRNKDQFGIRVVMNSWSEALLSHEQNWKAEEILEKLKTYMDFLSQLKSRLFLRDDS